MTQRAGTASIRLPSPLAALRADGVPAPATVQRRALYLVGEEDRSAARPVVAAERTMICLNGKWHAMRGNVATFEQIVGLAITVNPGQTVTALSVTYRRGGPDRSAGSLNPGDVVPIVEGMLFNANATVLS